MAVFSCFKPSTHDTLPRAARRVEREALAPVGSSNGHSLAVLSSSHQAGHGRGQIPSTSPLARDMSRRNGNGARLIKRERISKASIKPPTDFVHVSHVNRDEALISKEMVEVTNALRQSDTSPLSPSNTIIISNPATETTDASPSTRPSQDQSHPRQSLDGPHRKPTVNKRKAPPPVTPSIIKAAGLPPSLVSSNTRNQPLSLASPTRNAQALRSTPVKLKVKRQSKSPVDEVHLTAGITSVEAAQAQDIDGLGSLPSGPYDSLASLVTPAQSSGLSPPRVNGPIRSTTLQNLALSESMVNIAKHGGDLPTAEKDRIPLEDASDTSLVAPKPIMTSPSGPLAYMTDSTKIRWDNGMAEIARQLKQQDLDG